MASPSEGVRTASARFLAAVRTKNDRMIEPALGTLLRELHAALVDLDKRLRVQEQKAPK